MAATNRPTLKDTLLLLAMTEADPLQALIGSTVTFNRKTGAMHVDRVGPDEGEREALKRLARADADWLATARAADVGFAYVYTGPTCPGCLWPYDPAQDEHQAECCPACRAEDAAVGE